MKYPKVLQPSYLTRFNLKDKGLYYIEEKYDGSQFRFGIDKEGNRWFGSKGVTYSDERPPDKMFVKAVKLANEAMDRLFDYRNYNDCTDYSFFAEYLSKPKHNTLTYDRTPINNLVLFDVIEKGEYIEPIGVHSFSDVMELEPVKVFEQTTSFPTFNFIEPLLKEKSTLGDIEIEGVVVKNYDITMEINGEVRPLFYKYVRDDFKELNNEEWNKKPHKQPIESIISEILNKEAIFRKAIQHLEENGEAEGHMRDMQKLIPLVYEDLYEEYLPLIQEMLVKKFQKDIEKQAISGLAEFYKQHLYKKMESTLED